MIDKQPPRTAKLCPTTGTFDKRPGGTQWQGGPALFISVQVHDQIVKSLQAAITALEANANPK